MQVTARQQGTYCGVVYLQGNIFYLDDESHLDLSWMQPLEVLVPKKKPKAEWRPPWQTKK